MTKRSTWKGPFIKETFLKKFNSSKNKRIKTASRDTTILPFLIGYVIYVHNGKFYIPVSIKEKMIGHKLGEFVSTRLRHVHKKKKKKWLKNQIQIVFKTFFVNVLFLIIVYM